jgi:hypothetical protein
MRSPLDVFWMGIAGLVGCAWVWAACTVGCSSAPPLTPQQAIKLEDTAGKIAHCQAVGKQENSYRAYDCCMIAAGLNSGPTCSPAVTLPPQDAGHE